MFEIKLGSRVFLYGLNLTKMVVFAGLKQKYTQSNGRRPFGISCLLTGFDYDGVPHLYQTEPSGIYYEWKVCEFNFLNFFVIIECIYLLTEFISISSSTKANATGRSAKTVHEFLEKYYTPEEVSTEKGCIKLAIRALLEVVQSGQKNLEIAVMRRGQPLQVHL